MAVLKEPSETKFKFKTTVARVTEEEDESDMESSEEAEGSDEEDGGSEEEEGGSEGEEGGSEEEAGNSDEEAEGSEGEGDSDDEDGSDDDIPNDEPSDADDEDDDGDGKSGWADAMAKVLCANKEVKQPLLAKAKRDRDIAGLNKKKEKAEGDQDGAQETVKRETYAVRKAKKKEKDETCRTRPNIQKDRQREKKLAKLATKGVVQLFNAVRDQQKTLRRELTDAGGSIRKREKVFKNIDKEGFLEVLAGGKKGKIGGSAGEEKVKSNNRLAAPKKEEPGSDDDEVEPMDVKEEDDDDEEDQSSWKILRDDYMMGAKMKDWDKESDSE